MRNIPVLLQDSLSANASTLTRLLKIALKDGRVFGFCMSNYKVMYDDGNGPLLYVSSNGFDPTAFSSDISYSVDNAEGSALISEDVPGITTQMVDAGELDDGAWICYYVDYENPVALSAVILDAGDLGQVRTQFGLVWIPELLSYVMRLRQPVGGVYSRTCRAVFGSPAASQTGCGVDASGLWISFTVSSVGAENDRTFTANGLAAGPHPLYPGRVQWITGQNAGKEISTEQFNAGTVTLNETVAYPIQIGDQGRIRPDCDKTKGNCVAYNNYINMKAEDLIPVGDTAAISVPGAQT